MNVGAKLVCSFCGAEGTVSMLPFHQCKEMDEAEAHSVTAPPFVPPLHSLEGKLLDMEAFMRECCHNLGAIEGADMYDELWHAIRDARRYRWLRAGQNVFQTLGCATVAGEALDRGCDRGLRALTDGKDE